MEDVRNPVRGLEDDGETYENRDFDHKQAIDRDFYGDDAAFIHDGDCIGDDED